MEHWLEASLVLIAYAVGSVSFGLIVAARRGVDLRAAGSGNTGATNVGRTIGKREGRIVLVLDALKGLLPTALGALWLGADTPWTAATAAASVAGHCWPMWHGLRGGKGAATAAGAMLVLAWPAGLGAIATYLLAKRASRKTSVGSLAGATVGALGAMALSWTSAPATGGPDAPVLGAPALGAMAIAAMVWLRHADNLRRLARGEEPDS